MQELDHNLPPKLRKSMSGEHTSYGSTKRYLKRLPTEGQYIIQGPGENAGIVDLGNGMVAVFRMESHNHPSEPAPFEGAATGVGGILRDVFTMGAKPIALVDLLFFGRDERAQFIREGVTRGIGYYGNTVGVPTIGGEMRFDQTFNGNPLVNVGCIGLGSRENIIYGRAESVGSDLIYVGARTGKDGIDGGEMASRTLDNVSESAIQKSDPYLENLLMHACNELAKTGWIEGMQDMGAAGLLCSTTEVVLRGREKTGRNLGSKVYLNRIPTKLPMTAREILLSESQERMLPVGKREHREDILNLFRKHDLEAVVCGEVTEDGKYALVDENEEVEISADFDEIIPEVSYDWPLIDWVPQDTPHRDASDLLKRRAWRQYDWRVGTRTLKGPNKPGRFAILDLPEVPGELVISWSCDEGQSNYDPFKGVQHAFDTSYRRIIENGATPLGLTNCLNFGHPQDSMGAFVQTVEGLRERCLQFDVPVVGGNVSLYNAHTTETGVIHSIKPTPTLLMIGLKRGL